MVLKLLSILPLLILVLSCRETFTTSAIDFDKVKFSPDTSADSGRVFIVDNTGKEWDVTHAVDEYDFDPERFQYGSGPYAIRPILKPIMASPGDQYYLSDNESEKVIGTVINEMARAYPLSILVKHEIVDEQFGPTYVAVAF